MYYLDLEIGAGILCHHTGTFSPVWNLVSSNFERKEESFVPKENDEVQLNFIRQGENDQFLRLGKELRK